MVWQVSKCRFFVSPSLNEIAWGLFGLGLQQGTKFPFFAHFALKSKCFSQARAWIFFLQNCEKGVGPIFGWKRPDKQRLIDPECGQKLSQLIPDSSCCLAETFSLFPCQYHVRKKVWFAWSKGNKSWGRKTIKCVTISEEVINQYGEQARIGPLLFDDAHFPVLPMSFRKKTHENWFVFPFFSWMSAGFRK